MSTLAHIHRPVVLMVLVSVCAVSICAVSVCTAQRRRYWRGDSLDDYGRNGVPQWPINEKFKNDVFTFVRVKYSSMGYGRGNGWRTDYPDCELNFSLRLQQLTSMKVNPDPIILELTDEKLFNYPFIYMVEPGRLQFYQDEIEALRRYCLNGGFLMVDDFWGDQEYNNFYRELKRVFPHREPAELPLAHQIFNCV